MIRLLTILGLIGVSQAETVSWFSDPNATNQVSSGAAMPAGFQFQLGAFSAGFTPTAGNAVQWASHWVAAETAAYNSAGSFFSGQFTLASNAPPFSVNGKAWVWGFRNTATESEWLLFRATSWTWPVANPFSPPLIQWNVRDANEVVLGTIHPSGSPFLMRSAAVRSYSQWVATELVGQPANGPGDDPDLDGVTNIFEFAYGTSPVIAGGPPPLVTSWHVAGGARYLQLTIPRRRDRLALYSVEASGDLVQWQSGANVTASVADEAVSWTVRDLVPQSTAAPRRFLRFKVLLP